jgi:cell division protein FtsW
MSKNSLVLIISVLILFALGVVMIFNTTAAEILDRSLTVSTHQALLRQLFYGFLALVFGSGVYMMGYRRVLQVSPLFLLFFTFLLILVFIPGIGQNINGAKRWIGVGGFFSFQPSEFAKYCLPIAFIYRLTFDSPYFHDFKSFIKVMLLFALPLSLIMLEPDNGTVVIVGASFIALFVLVNIPLKYWMWPLLVVMVLGGVVAYNMPHVPDRIRVYFNPELDLQGKGHQPHQAKIAAGSGRLFGKGLGESLQKMEYLPEARSDYIAAIYAEEFGFLGMALLISLYLLVAYIGFSIAYNCKDIGGFYLAVLLTFMISFQAFLNLGVVSGLLPSKGTTLPFFSQGGSSLIGNAMAIALLLNIERKGIKWAKI